MGTLVGIVVGNFEEVVVGVDAELVGRDDGITTVVEVDEVGQDVGNKEKIGDGAVEG